MLRHDTMERMVRDESSFQIPWEIFNEVSTRETHDSAPQRKHSVRHAKLSALQEPHFQSPGRPSPRVPASRRAGDPCRTSPNQASSPLGADRELMPLGRFMPPSSRVTTCAWLRSAPHLWHSAAEKSHQSVLERSNLPVALLITSKSRFNFLAVKVKPLLFHMLRVRTDI